MTIKKAIKILQQHNKWRRGSDKAKMCNATELGVAIETVINFSKEKIKDNEKYPLRRPS